MSKKMIRMVPRQCECCGGADLEDLWRHEFEARTRADSYWFSINNVICRRCGFVFVSPGFHEDDIRDYYCSAFGVYGGQSVDYDLALRGNFLQQYDPKPDTVVEIGGNTTGPFDELLRRRYRVVRSVEINNGAVRDLSDTDKIADSSVGSVVHYFVLEHIPNVARFLSDCHRMLAPNGMMICEVPDIAIYPDIQVAQQLYEHTNHFSKGVLQRLVSAAGFEVIGLGAASRAFGFALACKKRDLALLVPVPNEYAANKRFFEQGLKKIRAHENTISNAGRVMRSYRERGEPVLMWAANDMAAAFLRGNPQPNTVIVDSDPQKKGALEGCSVMTPDQIEDDIRTARAIFIFTRNHAAEIIRRLEVEYQTVFSSENIHIIDFE